jgi:hypothetical protein
MGVPVPWPVSNDPGLRPQEGTGRLINVYAEPRGDGTPLWRRAPGAKVFARDPSAGSAVIQFSALGVSSVIEAAGSANVDVHAAAVGDQIFILESLGDAVIDISADAVGVES